MGLELESSSDGLRRCIAELTENADLAWQVFQCTPARADAMEFSDLYIRAECAFRYSKRQSRSVQTLEDANNKDYSIGA